MKRKAARPVHILPMGASFPSIRQASLAILDATTGDEVKLTSVCGRVSRIVNSKSGTGTVFNFTVTRGPRPERNEEE